MSYITGKSIAQLRNETAIGILNNGENFSKAMEAKDWMQSHYPKEINTLLLVGGNT